MKQTSLLKTLFLLCALVVGSVSTWADTYTMWLDSGTKNGTRDVHWTSNNATLIHSNVSWSASFSGGSITNSNYYVQIGSKNSPFSTITLSTSGISGTITEVKVGCGAYQSNATVAVTVGGNAFGGNAQTVGGAPDNSNPCAQKTFSGSASGEIVITITNGNNGRAGYIDYVSVTYTTGGTPTCATPTFSPAAGVFTSAQNVTISTTTEDATIYYTEDGSTPTASSTPYTGAIAVSSTTTIKAIAVKEGNNNSSVASATYTIIEHAGTQADPYTVADARAAIDAGVGVTDVYVTGIVCVGGSNLSSGAMNYWISDDGTETDKFEVYKGKNLNNTNFSAVTDVIVGDQVVVYGNIKKFNSTYEFDQGNYLVSLISLHPSVALDKTAINAPYAGADGTINVVYSNITTVVAEVVFCDENGDDTTYNWIAADLNASNNVEYIIDANTGAGRTAYFMVKALDDNSNEVFSDIVTITQAACPYATLPFAFNDGKDDIASAAGMTQDGLGTDYGSAPKLKFDGTGDYVLLRFNEAPVALSFDVKGNSFENGTFTVQTSADGETYTDLKAYTELGATETESFALASTVRYIKWVYTEKVNGNVALGNIKLTNDANAVVAVTVSAVGLATFASDSKLDFTNVPNIEAYIAKENGGKIELTQVNKVPAETGVLLRALNNATDFVVPVTEATADKVTGNLFVRGNDAAVATGSGPYNWILSKKGGVVGFYHANGNNVAKNRAYLQTVAAEARINLNFDDEDATAIEAVKTQNVENGQYFNLAGQRVAQPTKGLYIVNGKKVIIK